MALGSALTRLPLRPCGIYGVVASQTPWTNGPDQNRGRLAGPLIRPGAEAKVMSRAGPEKSVDLLVGRPGRRRSAGHR